MLTSGTKIRTIRILRGLSQGHLARMAGISTRSVSLAESDKASRPTVKKIETALSIDLASPAVEAAFALLAGE